MARRPAIAREPRGPARPSSARGPADLPAKVGWPTARLPRDRRLAAEPPDAVERARNDRILRFQRNRNPFVDDPATVTQVADF